MSAPAPMIAITIRMPKKVPRLEAGWDAALLAFLGGLLFAIP
jgi:hypothetical protein